MEQSNGFNFPQTLKEKVVQRTLTGVAGLAALYGLYLLLPIIVSVFSNMVLAGLLFAGLFAMLTLKGPFVTGMRVLAKKISIKFLSLMPVEHMEIVYDSMAARVQEIAEVLKMMRGNVAQSEAKRQEFEGRADDAQRLAERLQKNNQVPEARSQAGIAVQFAERVKKYTRQRDKYQLIVVGLTKLLGIGKAHLQGLQARKEIAADEWEQAQLNAQATTALQALFGGGPDMEMFEASERFIRDECAGSFGELNAIFDQVHDLMSGVELGQEAAIDDLLKQFSNRVDRLGHDTPSFQIPTNLDVADADFVPVQSPKAAVTKFIPRQ